MYRYLIGCVCFISLLSCAKPKQKAPVTQDTFIDVLAELHAIQAYTDLTRDSVTAVRLQDSVFHFYNITRFDFLRSESLYQRNPVEYHQILEGAVDRISEETRTFHQVQPESQTPKN